MEPIFERSTEKSFSLVKGTEENLMEKTPEDNKLFETTRLHLEFDKSKYKTSSG
jgi:hypothetical protein